jgi:hypothetical protein
MTDVSFVDLVVRMLVSLAIVLGLMFGAYVLLRRRQGIGSMGMPRLPRPARSLRPAFPRVPASAGVVATGVPRSPAGDLGVGTLVAGGRTGAVPARAAGNRRGLRVLGRVGIGRTSQVVALQFADRVFLMAASDQAAPTVIAEMDLAAWSSIVESYDDQSVPVVREAIDPAAPRPSGLIASLREATTRRG